MTGSPPIRILVVDDEVRQLQAVCDILGDRGYDVTGASDPQAALLGFTPGRYDLVLTDLMMPGMDGIALVTAISARDAEVVCILMTGAGSIGSAVEAMKAGAFDYLLKPYTLSALLPVFARALAVRRLRLDNAALTRANRERTRELELLNRELEGFAHAVSHDLRAPLRGINGLSRILLEDHLAGLDASAQDYLHRIGAAVIRMGQLIDDLLRLAQVSRAALVHGRVDLSGIARTVAETLRAGDAGRVVDMVIADDLNARGDAGLLRIVVENLLGNAWKFTGKTGGARIVFARETTAQGEAFSVRDNGAGFAMGDRSHLFKPFQRMHTTREFPGTGVGLATVHRILDRHGGQVWIESAPGQGTAVFFRIPEDPSDI
jgi:signal transduction histidine kinase